jgi:hypothetical protein
MNQLRNKISGSIEVAESVVRLRILLGRRVASCSLPPFEVRQSQENVSSPRHGE